MIWKFFLSTIRVIMTITHIAPYLILCLHGVCVENDRDGDQRYRGVGDGRDGAGHGTCRDGRAQHRGPRGKAESTPRV